jgi:hypothetical protein
MIPQVKDTGSAVASWQQGNNRWYMLQGHIWGNPWVWEFLPTCYLLFAYAVPTRRELLYFRILAMQTSRLEILQKRERNNSISFCFSAKQLLSFNYLYFLDSGNFSCRIELDSLHPSFLTYKLHNSSTPQSPTRRLPQNELKYAYASLRPLANCLHPTMYKLIFI